MTPSPTSSLAAMMKTPMASVGPTQRVAKGPDIDADGQCDNDIDNCDAVFNPDQEDMDGDGLGDACSDMDGDGLMTSDGDCDDTDHQSTPARLKSAVTESTKTVMTSSMTRRSITPIATKMALETKGPSRLLRRGITRVTATNDDCDDNDPNLEAQRTWTAMAFRPQTITARRRPTPDNWIATKTVWETPVMRRSTALIQVIV